MKAIIVLLAFVAVATASPFARRFDKIFPDRIVGGNQASRGQFPYIVQVKRDNIAGTGGQYCGGSIINANSVLTAAHCTFLALNRYTIVAGEHNLNQNEGSEQERQVGSVIRHPNYNDNTLANDIAIFKLTSDFTFNQFVQPSSLASDVPAAGVNATVAGWGTTSSGGSVPADLMFVNVPMVSDASCRSSYGSGNILPGMICAGVAGRDSCQGDSGGPLVNAAGQGIGIVSWGFGCAEANYPGVYTSVPFFRDWIANNA